MDSFEEKYTKLALEAQQLGLEELSHAILRSIHFGVVIDKGSQFYGKTTQDLGEMVEKAKEGNPVPQDDMLPASDVSDEPPQSIEKDLIDKGRSLLKRLQGRVPASFGLKKLKMALDDFEFELNQGNASRTNFVRLRDLIEKIGQKLGEE